MKRKTGLKGIVECFFVDFNPIDTKDILRMFLMKGTWYKIMFGIVKKMFMRLLISIVNSSNYTKWISLSIQKCMIQPTHINLHPN